MKFSTTLLLAAMATLTLANANDVTDSGKRLMWPEPSEYARNNAITARQEPDPCKECQAKFAACTRVRSPTCYLLQAY